MPIPIPSILSAARPPTDQPLRRSTLTAAQSARLPTSTATASNGPTTSPTTSSDATHRGLIWYPPNPLLRDPRPRLPAAAYTLIELLVVMVILVILIATALPLAKRVMDNDRIREASRQLNAYFAMAKTHAVRTGRPCGLLFEC